jgi:hypothetical protein
MADTALAEIYAYQPLRAVGPGLYCMDGRWKRSPLLRRMTVLKNSSGELAIHSAIRLHDQDYEQMIDPLGRVGLILIPSALHADEARFYIERYPHAQVFAPAPVRAQLEGRVPRIDASYEQPLPESWRTELVALQIDGTKLGEALFWHRRSATMIATDLVFHCTAESVQGLARWIMRLNGAYERVGPSRIFRWMFLRDRRALARSMQPIKSWQFERIVMSHGTIVEHDGKRKFLDGYRVLGV